MINVDIFLTQFNHQRAFWKCSVKKRWNCKFCGRPEIFDTDWIITFTKCLDQHFELKLGLKYLIEIELGHSLSVVVWFVSNAKSSCEVYICNGFSFKQFKCHKHQIPKYNYKYSNKHIIVILVLITFTKCLDQHFELKIKSETLIWTFISFEQNGLSLR